MVNYLLYLGFVFMGTSISFAKSTKVKPKNKKTEA